MTRTASAYGLETRRAPDWRADAACHEEDPELWFALDTTITGALDVEKAKIICNRCLSQQACLDFALTNHIGAGIFGGLTEDERASIRRSTTRRNLSPGQAAAKAEEKRQPEKPRTLQSIYDDNTVRLYDGHLGWTGGKKVHFKGKLFTPKQLSFLLHRGRMPDGPVRTECSSADCILPSHLADAAERARCGTRPGYQRHRKQGEDACGPCKQANTDADNRLRRTGTTKVAV